MGGGGGGGGGVSDVRTEILSRQPIKFLCKIFLCLVVQMTKQSWQREGKGDIKDLGAHPESTTLEDLGEGFSHFCLLSHVHIPC